MSQLLEGFNPYDHNPEQSAGQLPVGRHPVVAIGAEVKATKSNDGGLVEFTLSIIDGPCKGQTGPYRVNLYNASPKAVEIAKRQLSALCYVTGRFQLGQNGTDLSPLFNVPFIVDVAPQQGNEQYTEITKLFDINGNAPKAQGGGQQQQQAPVQNTGFGGGNPAGNFQQQQPAHTAAAPENTNSFQNGNASAGQNNWQQPQQNNGGFTAPANNGFNGGNPAAGGGGKPAWAK